MYVKEGSSSGENLNFGSSVLLSRALLFASGSKVTAYRKACAAKLIPRQSLLSHLLVTFARVQGLLG